MITRLSCHKDKHFEVACQSLNRVRYGTDTVSKLVPVYDPTYWEVVDLFQDFFQTLEEYTKTKKNLRTV